MGINGLLPFIKPIMKKVPISKFKNSRIAIDGHSWIHQVLPSISYELFHNKTTDRHIKLFLEKIIQLQRYNITPIFVFDGDFLESKAETIQQRRDIKEGYRQEITKCIKKGDNVRARELMKRVVDVKPEIIYSILIALQLHRIEYIISPYEADAQLCYLQKIGYVDYIVTEDSDLIIFGGNHILYKYNGSTVEEYERVNLPRLKGDFFAENILEIAILSGCDYVNSIKGVGLATAFKKLQENKTIKSFVEYYRELRKPVPKSYLEDVAKAKIAFLFHIIYDPIERTRKYLNSSEEHFEFLGTLENLRYIINEITKVDRHFVPRFDDIQTTKIDDRPIEDYSKINNGLEENSSIEFDMLTSVIDPTNQ